MWKEEILACVTVSSVRNLEMDFVLYRSSTMTAVVHNARYTLS